MDSGFVVDASSGLCGKEDGALAVQGRRARASVSKGSDSTWGEGGGLRRLENCRESETPRALSQVLQKTV